MKLIAFVGMPASGKSEASAIAKKWGFLLSIWETWSGKKPREEV